MKKWGIVLGLTLLAGCGEGDITEVGRYPSPIGEVDAVVGQMKAGEADPYLVTLTRTGEKAAKGPRLLLVDKAAAPKVEWIDPDHVVVTCDGDARVWSYRNFWTNGTATVAVGLKCGAQGWR